MNLSTDNTRIVTVVTAILPQTCNQSTESFVKFLLNSTAKIRQCLFKLYNL